MKGAASRDGISVAGFLRRRGTRSLAVLLSLVALMIQLGIPLVHHPASAWMTADDGGTLEGATLCSDHGVADADRPASDRPDPDRKAPLHKPAPCPICQTLQGMASFLPPTGTLLLDAHAPAGLEAVAARPAIMAPTLRSPAQPRAPPATA